ncbi:MAG: SirB2 family protein [Pseudomonadota bacterium]
MDYLTVKHFHMSCAALSGSLFLLRGSALFGAPPLRQRWLRVLPHVVDTLLLASAITLAVWSAQYPFVQAWLSAKVLALLAYIILGSIALRQGKSLGVRRIAFVAALGAFAYIVSVALTKHPQPWQ